MLETKPSVWELDAQHKEGIGYRFGVIRGRTGKLFISAIPNSIEGKNNYEVVAKDLLYSEAKGLVKLMGGDYGNI